MISDFGLSKTEEDDSMMATACGTPGYVGRFMEINSAEYDALGIAFYRCHVNRGDKRAIKNVGSHKDFVEFQWSHSLGF